MVKWVTGEVTEEPLKVIFEDCPGAAVEYARNKRLLNLPGWTAVKKIDDAEQLANRSVRQTQRRGPAVVRTRPKEVAFTTHAGVLQQDGDITFTELVLQGSKGRRAKRKSEEDPCRTLGCDCSRKRKCRSGSSITQGRHCVR